MSSITEMNILEMEMISKFLHMSEDLLIILLFPEIALHRVKSTWAVGMPFIFSSNCGIMVSSITFWEFDVEISKNQIISFL